MDYQVTNSVGEAALNLLDAKQRIDEAKIEADYWMLVDVVEPKIVMGSENHKLAERDSINVVNKRVFWPTYLMVAGYTKKLWEQGYWTEIQEKYHI